MFSTKKSLVDFQSGFIFFLAMPNSELYRLVVDGHFHALEKGFLGYEHREEDSIKNVLKAIWQGKDFIIKKQPISIEYLKNIHKTCALALKEKNPGEFKEAETHGFSIHQISVDGLLEMCRFSKKYPSINVSYLEDGFIKTNFIKYQLNKKLMIHKHKQDKNFEFKYTVDLTTEKCEVICEIIIERLNNALLSFKNDDELIDAIVDCVYDLEHLHPFEDANLRTNIVLANLLLMQHGFPPVTYFNPNNLDGCSKLEFSDILKKGMLKTLDIIDNPEAAHFSFASSTLTLEEKNRYALIISPITLEKKKLNDKTSDEIIQQRIQQIRIRIEALRNNNEPKWILTKKEINHENSTYFLELENEQACFQGSDRQWPIANTPKFRQDLSKSSNSLFQVPSNLTSSFISHNHNINSSANSPNALSMEKELFNIITSQWMDKGKQLIEVKKLLDAGANPHLAIENSYTCIEVASMLEKNDILKVLESSEKMENARIQDIGANIR